MEKRRGIAVLRLLRVGLVATGLAAAAAPVLRGQEAPNTPETPETPAGPPVTVRGVVLNAATGQPLRRALVKVLNIQGLGALTDGEGKFEIGGVSGGDWTFEAAKPGFTEQLDSDEAGGFAAHAVRVASGMPELSFSLAPKNAIFGHVTLSTGAPALGIGLTLVRQAIVDGRAGWEEVERHQTTPDGAFRFSGLRGGTYLLMTQPEFDNDRAAVTGCNADAPAEMPGYAAQFYNDAQELAGAARIVVAGGQNAEVNLALNLTKFHLVEAAVVRAPAGDNWKFSHTLLDHGGQEAEYPVHEEKDHSLCTYLPDGSYMLAVQASKEDAPQPQAGAVHGREGNPKDLAGFLEFSVDGQAARNLRLPLAQGVATPVHLRYEPGPPRPIKASRPGGRDEGEEPDEDPLDISATRVNAASEKKPDERLVGTRTGDRTYELETASPGAYWIHASASREGVCAGAVSAAGQNLARTPWTAGPSGAGTPIDVVLRTDCAKLTVQMPAALLAQDSGEGATLHVYAVPEFDSIEGVSQSQIEQFGERTAAIEDLTPGQYRVFAFRSARSIEFRNPAALDRLGRGQEVTLQPGSSVTLVLEGLSR